MSPTTEPERVSTTTTEQDSDTAVRPDIWNLPGSGMAWCECGENHSLPRQDVTHRYRSAGFRPGRRVPHRTVVRATQELWRYEWVCRFFHLKVEDAAVAVTGAVRTSYLFDDAVDITGLFTQTWQGCPEEACAAVTW